MKKYLWFHMWTDNAPCIEVEEVLEETKTLYRTKTRRTKKNDVKCVKIEDEADFLLKVEAANKAFVEVHGVVKYIKQRCEAFEPIHHPTVEGYNAYLSVTKEMLRFLRDNKK